MIIVRSLLCGGLLALSIAAPSTAWVAQASAQSSPPVFNRDGASAIGRARQHYDRAQYERYEGNPGAQFELRQKRQNLCRNVPEMC